MTPDRLPKKNGSEPRIERKAARSAEKQVA